MLKIVVLLSLLLSIGCSETYTPKPKGYFRIDFPEKAWVLTGDSLPYRFEMAKMATVEVDKERDAEAGWINVVYGAYHATLHLSYKRIAADTALEHYVADCHHLAYTHTIKAESINEKFFKKGDVFGLVYYIEGNTASSTQFFVTDSTRNFVRGALYFNQHPDKDSLAPVIAYLREDVVRLMETIRFR